MSEKKIAILFSGGADSTACAVHFLEKGYDVHLLTFDNGAERGFGNAESRGAALAEKFPGRCRWMLLDCKPFFHALAIKSLEKDVKKHGNLVCCGCKLAMLAEAVLYCRKNGIPELADGFKVEQDFYPEQTPEYLGPADAFADGYGVAYRHPFFPPNALSDRIAALSGSVPGSPVQPKCLFGENPILDKTHIRPYVESKLPAMKAYVDRHLFRGHHA